MTADLGDAILRVVGKNGFRLRYFLLRTDTKRLTVSVHPDLSVSVTAPFHAPLGQVDTRVLARSRWIGCNLRRFERLHPLPVPRRYVTGETHLYLGRQYRLCLASGDEKVELLGGRLIVMTPGRKSRSRVQSVLDDWYRARASEIFLRRQAALLRRFPWLVQDEMGIRVRAMSIRWGSCGPRGVITLNVELVKAPVSCIDYVLAHELCHRLELRHSRRFYSLLRRAMPEWERARERLNLVIR